MLQEDIAEVDDALISGRSAQSTLEAMRAFTKDGVESTTIREAFEAKVG